MYHKLKKCLNSRSNHQRCSIEQKRLFLKILQYSQENTCWFPVLIDLQASRPATSFKKKRLQHRCFPMNIAKFLRTLILKKICEQMLLPFLLLTVNISSQGLIYVFNSMGPCQRSSSRFKELSLGCFVVGSSLVRKKENSAEIVTRCHSLYHQFSIVVPLVDFPCTTRCHSMCHSSVFL